MSRHDQAEHLLAYIYGVLMDRLDQYYQVNSALGMPRKGQGYALEFLGVVSALANHLIHEQQGTPAKVSGKITTFEELALTKHDQEHLDFLLLCLCPCGMRACRENQVEETNHEAYPVYPMKMNRVFAHHCQTLRTHKSVCRISQRNKRSRVSSFSGNHDGYNVSLIGIGISA